MNKITIAQFYTSNLSHGPFAEAINRKYCQEQGYEYYVDTDNSKILNILDGRAPTWYKSRLILDVFEQQNPDYVLFLDTDAIISDFSGRIEQFIDDDYSFIAAKDISEHSAMNAGVFLIKNNEWSKQFLQDWWDLGETTTGSDFSDRLPILENELEKKGIFKHKLWLDQSILTLMYDQYEKYQKEIKIIPHHSFNHREYNDGNFIFHAYAYGHLLNRKLDIIYNMIFETNTLMPERLVDIAGSYNTDKNYEHNYFNLIYSELLSPLKHELKTFIEIGCLNGQSLLLWNDFFPNAKIYGLDIDIDRVTNMLGKSNSDRIELIHLDCSEEDALLSFNNITDVDVILDDASHKMKDQQITLAHFFKLLKSGGIYILEDLHTSLEAANPEKSWCGWGDPDKTLTLNMLEEFNKTGKIISDYINEEDRTYLEQNIESINIYRNRPDWSITSIIIKK